MPSRCGVPSKVIWVTVLATSDRVVRHCVANGGAGAGAGGPVRLGIERFYSLTADVSLGANYAETEAILIEAGVTVFQNLFMISGFLSLPAIVPAS